MKQNRGREEVRASTAAALSQAAKGTGRSRDPLQVSAGAKLYSAWRFLDVGLPVCTWI